MQLRKTKQIKTDLHTIYHYNNNVFDVKKISIIFQENYEHCLAEVMVVWDRSYPQLISKRIMHMCCFIGDILYKYCAASFTEIDADLHFSCSCRTIQLQLISL